MDLRDRSDEELLSSIAKLTGSHRELTAALVAHLAELEERKLHLLAGYASLFEFCTKTLRFSEGEACRRILAARLCRRFPVAHSMLASGDVNLSTLELLPFVAWDFATFRHAVPWQPSQECTTGITLWSSNARCAKRYSRQPLLSAATRGPWPSEPPPANR